MMTASASHEPTLLREQLAALANGVAVAWGWRPELLRVTGSQPLAALDRIVSQAVKDLSPGEGRLALVLHARGQFRGLFAVLAEAGEAWLLVPAGRAGELAKGLERYLALSRCRIEPMASVGTAVLVGPGWEAVAAGYGAELERLRRGGWSATGAGEDRLIWYGWTLLGVAGAVVAFTGEAARQAFARRLAEVGAVAVEDEALELVRIAAGWPAWGAELTDATLPPEIAVLDELAISYRKGCYTGQETIARMKTYGHPNWRLVRLCQVAGPTGKPELPADLFPRNSDKPKARLTSWAWHPDRGGVALAMLHRTAPPEERLHDRSGREFALAG